MTVSILSPFRFKEDPRPSIFLAAGWGRGGSSGKTLNVIQTAAVVRKTKRDGRSPGTLKGISSKADKQIAAYKSRRKA